MAISLINNNMSKKKTKQLSTSKKKELEEWDKKIRSGKARGITKDRLLKYGYTDCDPRHTLDKLSKEVIPKIDIEGKTTKDLSEKELELLSQFNIDYGIENNLSMVESVEARYRGLIINLRRELIKEYNCKSYGEKALIDMMVGAYARNLSLTKRLINSSGKDYTTALLNNYISAMSKEVDRANRHFITALETLRQMKQPELKVNIKSKNAFIAQNQQFNNSKTKEDEIIEAK
jgi:hypothetical protein